MKPTIEQLENLLAARRVEGPGENYWQEFLCEFHRRQRERVVPESAFLAGWERLKSFVADLGSAKWSYGAGFAYAALTVGFFLMPAKVSVVRDSGVPASHQVVPAARNARPASVDPAKNTRPELAPPVDPVF